MERPTSRSTGRFLAVTYNILASSLGSNCIPWVMTLSDEWKKRLSENCSSQDSSSSSSSSSPPLLTGPANAAKTSQQLDRLLTILAREYLQHFHKNIHSHSDSNKYYTMRKLWSVAKLESESDILATGVDRVDFVSPWTVAYTHKQDGTKHQATTMGGLLRRELGVQLGAELFDYILSTERTVYDWSVRGPRIFKRVTDKFSSEDGTDLGMPSIICLQEYDVHNRLADYRGLASGKSETFCEAMRSAGYRGFFFPGISELSGEAIFWKEQDFLLDTEAAKSLGRDAEVVESNGSFDPNSTTILLNNQVGGAAFNHDLQEHWHSVRNNGAYEIMGEFDRRNAGIVRLRHKVSGRSLWVLCTHLMTNSRDNPKKNMYPGEVRAGEIAELSQIMGHLLKEEFCERPSIANSSGNAGGALRSDVLWMGDFNTDAGEEGIFSGHIKLAQQARNSFDFDSQMPSKLSVPTGFLVKDGVGQFHWPLRSNNEADAEARDDALECLVLLDPFEPVHQRRSHVVTPDDMFLKTRADAGVDVPPEFLHATSHNSKRREFIDHVWASTIDGGGNLVPLKVSDTRLGWRNIPHEEEPSDHIPIGVLFEFSDADLEEAGATGAKKSPKL